MPRGRKAKALGEGEHCQDLDAIGISPPFMADAVLSPDGKLVRCKVCVGPLDYPGNWILRQSFKSHLKSAVHKRTVTKIQNETLAAAAWLLRERLASEIEETALSSLP